MSINNELETLYLQFPELKESGGIMSQLGQAVKTTFQGPGNLAGAAMNLAANAISKPAQAAADAINKIATPSSTPPSTPTQDQSQQAVQSVQSAMDLIWSLMQKATTSSTSPEASNSQSAPASKNEGYAQAYQNLQALYEADTGISVLQPFVGLFKKKASELTSQDIQQLQQALTLINKNPKMFAAAGVDTRQLIQQIQTAIKALPQLTQLNTQSQQAQEQQIASDASYDFTRGVPSRLKFNQLITSLFDKITDGPTQKTIQDDATRYGTDLYSNWSWQLIKEILEVANQNYVLPEGIDMSSTPGGGQSKVPNDPKLQQAAAKQANIPNSRPAAEVLKRVEWLLNNPKNTKQILTFKLYKLAGEDADFANKLMQVLSK